MQQQQQSYAGNDLFSNINNRKKMKPEPRATKRRRTINYLDTLYSSATAGKKS